MQTEGSTASAAELSYWEMVLTVVQGPYKGRELTFISDSITAGKAPQNDIHLLDETVSRHHLEIVREGRSYLLRDLGSTNGTFLDGSEIREAYLRTGAQVTLGQTRFKFRAVERRVPVAPWQGGPFEGLWGECSEMRRVFGMIQAVAPLGLTVVLEGEEGSGRRSLAGVLHHLSPLASAPLVVLDCGELPLEQAESALLRPGVGVLDSRGGGTVVLLEPWEIPPNLQGAVAEAIRCRQVPESPGGRSRAASSEDRRIVAATSRFLEDELARGRLSRELFSVLDRVHIRIPPLSERPGDARILLEHFLVAGGVPMDAVPRERLEDLLEAGEAAGFPGNLRALRLQAEAMARRLLQGGQGLSTGIRGGARGEVLVPDLAFDEGATFGESKQRWVVAFERAFVAWLLEQHGGNVSRASRSADMDRKHLHRLLKRYGHR